MTVRISELIELSTDLSQTDVLPIVDLSAAETKQITVANLLTVGISGAPSSFIDLAKLNQSSATKLSSLALDNTGVASGTYGDASNVARFTVNSQGIVSFASGVPIVISAGSVTGLAPVATSGTYASLSGLPTLGTLAAQNAASIAVSGGTISGVTFISGDVTISGGTISGITDLALLDGGTGASTASDARTNLGLAIGSDVQPYSAVLSDIATQFDQPDEIVYASASGVVAGTPFTSFARSIVSGSTASGVRGTLGLGTMAVQDASSVALTGGTISGVTFVSGNVTISGGTISGITDLAIADGGTGASSAADARTNLGLVIGTDIQSYSAVLSGIATQFDQSDEIVYASASGVVAGTPFTSFARSIVSGSTASGVRSTLGLGTMSVQDANSVALSGGTISGVTFISGNVTISGGTINGITDLALLDGGTGASTASDARANLGLAIGSDVQAYSAVLSGVAGSFAAADEIIYASASGVVTSTPFTSFARSIVSGSTASDVRSTLGLGTMAVQDASSVALSGGTISGVTFVSSNATITGGVISGITDLAIADGGTGASTASDARTSLGLAIGTNVQAYNSALSNIATTASGSDLFFYTTSSGVVNSSSFSAAARGVVAAVTISGIRDALGLGDVAILDEIIVASGNISSGAVTTSAIEDAAVTTIKIAEQAVTLNKLAPTSTSNVILGRATASGGTVEEITCTAAARSILDDASVADIRTTLALGTLATQNGTFSGTSSGDNTGDQTITLTGDVTGTGTGSFATTIAASAVTEAAIATDAVSTGKILANAVTAEKLDDDSAAVVAAASPSGSGAFIGQQWFNTNNAQEFTWTGSAWVQQAGIGTINIVDSTPIAIAVAYPDAYSATLTATLDTQAAATVFAGPETGADTAPTFRAIVPGDIPDATASTKGIIQPGTGLAIDAGTLNHANTVTGATVSSITFDNQGHITAAIPLVAADIPELDASKITTGTFPTALIADESITGAKIADSANVQFGETLPVAEHIGQFFFNPLEGSVFLWDGNVWQPVGVTTGAIILAGTYDATLNQIVSTTLEGAAIGLTAGSPLPSSTDANANYYVVVSVGGTGTAPAPTSVLAPPDLILSTGSAWVELDVSGGAGAIAAVNVVFSAIGDISATNVQLAIEEVSTECRNATNITSGTLAVARGGTGLASYTKGDILGASAATTLTKLTVGTNGQVLRANSATATGLEWGNDFVGTVTTVTSSTAALTIATATTTPALTIRSATTSVNGIVQLSNSTSTTSSVLAATPTAVKSAYDLAALALPKAGGIITGALEIGTTGSLVFEGATADGFETTLTVADPTADHTITLPNLTGTVALTSQLNDGTY
jgi:hypothetical protein